MANDPGSGDDTPRDPWGNPLPPEDRPPQRPRPEDYPPPFPGDAPGTPGAAPPGYNPAWPPTAGGPPPPGAPGVASQGWGQGQPWAPVKNDGLAVGSLVASLVSILLCGIVLGPVGMVMGFVARRRIRSARGAVKGDGLALAGIVIGAVGTILAVVSLIILIRNPDVVDDLFDRLDTTTTTVVEDDSGN